MNDQPDDIFNFPCEFPIKIMGRTGVELEIAVLEIVRKHVPDLAEGSVTQRPSRAGNYQALTVTFTAQSRDQLDNIYRELTACEHTLMVL